MLRFLGVRHLAIIDHVEVEFEPGLNLLTGETGAGKSVLIEAIDLLVGGRASADLVRTGEELATIQAVFERPDGREVIVRREISAQGRSRAFIDDALATTSALRELGTALIDLHGQHEHQTLLDPSAHRGLLDSFLEDTDLLHDVGMHYDAWRAAAHALARTQLDEREKRARIEMASFQLQEIDKVTPVAGEDDSLATERAILSNADRLSRLSTDAYTALYDDEHAALPQLALVWKRVTDLAALDPQFAPFLEQRVGIKSALEDLAHVLRSYASDLEASPDRLQTVEDRLAALDRLKRKHGPTLDDVLHRQQHLRNELAALEADDTRAAALQTAERTTRDTFLDRARTLSSKRDAAARELGRALVTALADLAMPQSRVDVRVRQLSDIEQWTRGGIDDVEFWLSPNPGEELRPLARIASGGELSRVMLALRTLAVGQDRGRTLVFDEVDAGIGGAAADAVGARLQQLAGQAQVICITHLPQIAARGGTHFRIAKQVRQGRTSTALVKLDPTAREEEIARMIAGASISAEVLASARDLLRTRGASESKPKGESESGRRTKAKGRPGGA